MKKTGYYRGCRFGSTYFLFFFGSEGRHENGRRLFELFHRYGADPD